MDNYNVSNKSNLVSTSGMELVFQKAMLMTAGYIGELTKKIDDNIKMSAPNLNWRRLGMSRNIIFHDYDIVDMEIISSVNFKDISEESIKIARLKNPSCHFEILNCKQLDKSLGYCCDSFNSSY